MSLASLAATSGVRTMGVAIRGDASSLTRELAKSAAEVDAWERKTSTSVGRWGAGWKVAAAGVAVGLALVVAGLAAAALGAIDFERNMRNVNSLLLLSNAELSALSTNVLDIAREVPQTAENLAEGLYNIASSGFAGAEGLLVLEASAKAASAGLATTDTAAQVVTSVLNAYGLSAASATDVSDVLFSTVNYGVVEFDELAGSIGNVVGMASAANVPISDVGSAIATMTLSGIGAAEASTSLNRVIQSLIQPSEALASVYDSLGYESGLVALESKGLYGVMEDLRGVTQGNAEAYLRLFPEIRAARGAFALASDEGSTYADIQAKIGDATARSGATQTAFAEQMESTSAKWSIFTSSMRANSIQVGSAVLPAFNAVLDVLNPMANEVLPALGSAWAMLSPYMATARDIGVDLWTILEAIYQAAAPIVGVLAGIAGAIAGVGLDILLTMLDSLTGLLADNQTLVVALAAAYASRFLPSIGGVVAALGAQTLSLRTTIAEQIRYQATLATGTALNGAYAGSVGRIALSAAAARTTLLGMAGAARTAGTAFLTSGAGLAVLTAGLAALVYAAQQAGAGVREHMAEITASTDNLDISGLRAATDEIIETRRALQETASAGDYGTDESGLRMLTSWSALINNFRHNREMDATAAALDEIGSKAANSNFNLVALFRETGVEISTLEQIAKTQGIDLTDVVSSEGAEAARNQVVAYIQDIEKQTGVSTAQMTDDWSMSVEEIEAFSKAVGDATSKASAAFLQATDVLGTWKPNIGVEEEKNALEALADARSELNDLESEAETNSDQLEAARRRVVDAESALTEAQAAKAAGTLTAFYENAIATGEAFSTNLEQAVQMGLDPAVVTKLLQQGPEQAGPIVEQMVADNSGALIEMVNAAETSLAEINGRVVEQARLTAIAVNSSTDDLSRQLSLAMDISSRSTSGMTTEEIAEALGLSPDRVQQVADNFGITLVSDLQASIPKGSPDGIERSLGLDVDSAATAGRNYGQAFAAALAGSLAGTPVIENTPGRRPTNRGQFASGGILPGYTPGRDVHRFYSPSAGWLDLSGGEGIARPEVVAAMGAARFQALNAAARSGGVEGVRRAMMPYLGGFANGTPSVRIEPVPFPIKSTHQSDSRTHIENYWAQSPGEEVNRAVRRRRGFDAIGGGG